MLNQTLLVQRYILKHHHTSKKLWFRKLQTIYNGYKLEIFFNKQTEPSFIFLSSVYRKRDFHHPSPLSRNVIRY
jgi:hypothetical protein